MTVRMLWVGDAGAFFGVEGCRTVGPPAAYAAYGIRVNAISPGRAGQVSDVVDGVLLLESSPGMTGKILRIHGTPNGQAASHETAG
jgi:hypothetical protein